MGARPDPTRGRNSTEQGRVCGVSSSLARITPMAYLDISPMLTALRDAPDEFDLRRGKLRHRPSRHTVDFTTDGRALITRTSCECAHLIISARHSAALKAAL